jgi:phosphate transport system substrate-binding protein
MKKLIVGLYTLILSTVAFGVEITGAGATFPMPIYSKWSEEYKKATGNSLNYQSIGSSGGIRQINNKTVAFGASDAPVKGEELDKLQQVQFPAIIGGTVPVINLDGFKPGELKITGQVLAEIYLGTITKWSDPKLVSLNPGKKLPDTSITVVTRADGSGTTFNFTDYLSSASKEWNDKIGKGSNVKWQADNIVGGKGNEGVAANVNRIKGSIGYVEYAYVKKNNMTFVRLENRSGNFVSPDDLTFASAAQGADWFSVPGMGLSIVNQPGKDTWPITTASFIIMYKNPDDKVSSKEVLKFFDWAFKNGKKLSEELDYVHLPEKLQNDIRQRVWNQIK